MTYVFDVHRDGTALPPPVGIPSIPIERPTDARRSSVDAARTTDENRNHWAQADALGPNAAFNEGVRAKLRNRGRYEALNNSYCRGLVRSLSYDLIGCGPRPQLTIPGDEDGTRAKIVETNYGKWARAVGLARKYRLMEKAAVRCGEVFGVLTTNRRIANPIQLDVRLLESEQCTTPFGLPLNPFLVDGILFDENWTPVEYYFLKYHPGETGQASFLAFTKQSQLFETIQARYVVHYYEQDRPNQARGIPKITAGLPLFAQGRRIRLATLTAMEFAAMLSGIMKTNLPPDTGTAAVVDNWNLFELVRGALLTLPQGWEASQFQPAQPGQNAESFARDTLNEAGRGMGAPLNVVTGNSSLYNFSSGRLDHVPYQHGLRIDRDDFELVVADPVFAAWEQEARLRGSMDQSTAQVDPSLPPIEEWDICWQWDGFGSIDPLKEANADSVELADGVESLAGILGEDGRDWQEHMDQLAREKQYAESKGLPWPLSKADDPTPAGGAPAAMPASLEETVSIAMSDAGIKEAQADEIIEALRPTFAQLRNGKATHNGHRRISA